MRLVTFEAGGETAAGALIEGDSSIVDLQGAYATQYGSTSPLLDSVLAMAAGGDAALDVAADIVARSARTRMHVIARADAVLLAPIPRPPQMRDFLCFEKHLIQATQALRRLRAQEYPDQAAAMADMERQGILAIPRTWYERPIFYHPNRMNVIGTDQDVTWPGYSDTMDFELEFGAFIGVPARDVSKEQARAHIFGYTIFNDLSARDEQSREMPGQLGPGKGKDFDGANVLGPCLVTADEIGDPYTLEMVVRVNGEEWGRGSSGDMTWRFEDCIAHVSRSETLHSGEFIGSGTVGNGCGLEQMRFLASGDTVELEVSRIGVLRTRVLRSR